MNYKIIIIRIIIGIVLVFSLYFCIHVYANGKVLKNYAEGFEKNPLGDYAKNKSNMVLAVYDAPLFKTFTNLSVSNSADKVDLVIWVPLYGGELSYGLVITDDENEKLYQIEVNEHLETDDADYKNILEKNHNGINAIKSVVKEEWNIDL